MVLVDLLVYATKNLIDNNMFIKKFVKFSKKNLVKKLNLIFKIAVL